MTVAELIALLETYPEDAEIRIAHQPAWPLQETIHTVVSSEEIGYEEAEAGEDGIVWIACRNQVEHAPYAPGAIFE